MQNQKKIALGGAIWTNNDLNIIAKNGATSLFSGNKTISNGVESPNAVYVSSDVDYAFSIESFNENKLIYTQEAEIQTSKIPTLTLNANTNGTIIFDDTIEGDKYGLERKQADLSISENVKSELAGMGFTSDRVDDLIEFYRSLDPGSYTDEEILGMFIQEGIVVIENEKVISSIVVPGYSLNLTVDPSGKIYLNNKVKNADISVSHTNVIVPESVNLSESQILRINSGVLNINHLDLNGLNFAYFSNAGTLNLNAIDVDLANERMGRLTATNYGEISGQINVNSLNLLNDAEKTKTNIPFADKEIAQIVTYTGVSPIAYTPIYKYNVSYNNETGEFLFDRTPTTTPSTPNGGTPSIPSPNPSNSFNPAILPTPVTAQAGAYTTQTFNYAFQHSDNFMILPSLERMAIKNQNKYALSPTSDATDTGVFSPLYTKQSMNGFWVKPYVSFENTFD